MIYEEKEGTFCFSFKGETFSSDSVWMIADKTCTRWTLLSHGPEEKVKNKFDEMSEAFKIAGFAEYAENLYLLDASNFSIEEINKCIEITNYIGNLIEADLFYKEVKNMLHGN